MTVIKTFVAEDGTKFDKEYECLEYEEQRRANQFKDTALLFDSQGNPLKLTSQDFEEAFFIVAKTDSAAEYMTDIFSSWVNPWSSHGDIRAGVWFFSGNDWVAAPVITHAAKIIEKITGTEWKLVGQD